MGKWEPVKSKQKISLGRGGVPLHPLLPMFLPWRVQTVFKTALPKLTLSLCKPRYVQKFYSMRTQLQAISLRIQTVRSNEQMMQSMKGATSLLGSMNRQMNLPALQRIAMEFEKENDIMDQRQEMMDDAIDDVTGLEDEEEGEEVVKEVLDEIGVDLGQAVCYSLGGRAWSLLERRYIGFEKGQMADHFFSKYRWARHPPASRRTQSQTAESQKL